MENKTSVCPSCNCMTHTVDGRCGKCGAGDMLNWRERLRLKYSVIFPMMEMDISSEIAAAEKRGYNKAIDSVLELIKTTIALKRNIKVLSEVKKECAKPPIVQALP